MFQKTLLAIVMLCFGIGLGFGADLPRTIHFQFDDRPYLRGAGEAASRVTLDPETRYQDHGSLKIAHSEARTSAYSSFRVPAAPGELQARFYIKGEKEGTCTLILNFNKAGGRNGSAGSVKFTVPVTTDWKLQELHTILPVETAAVQFVFALDGQANTVWLNDLYFGYGADTVKIPLSGSVSLRTPLNRPGWNPRTPFGAFYTLSGRASAGPTVQMAADGNGLFVAFQNPWNPEKAAAPAKSRDAALWNDDCDELFLFNPQTGQGWHFIVNANGAKYDARIYQEQDGDPWKDDPKWNAPGMQCLTSRTDNAWEARIYIPWADLGLAPGEGLTLGINFAAENKGLNENSSWEVGGSFREPNRFATMTLHDNIFTITRGRRQEKISYTVRRAKPVFDEVLEKGVPGHYEVGAAAHGCDKGSFPKALIAKAGDDEFYRWQGDLMKAWGEAGMTGPAFPWSPNYLKGGAAAVENLHKTYGMKFPYSMHSSYYNRIARQQGAKLILPRSARNVSPIDPVHRRVMTEAIRKWPHDRNYALMKDKIAYIYGIDEPFNGYTEIFSKTLNAKNQDALESVSEKVRSKYGFGKYGLPDEFGTHDAAIPFQRIAFCRWLNQELLDASIEWRDALREVFPGVPFEMTNNNTCGGMAPLDYALFDGESDALSVDPYPTSATYNFGFARGLYHTGFSVRMLHDLAPGAKTYLYPQCFIYCGGKPEPSDLREWASQALKNGAQGFKWFCTAAVADLFDCYLEMIAINKLVGRMDRLKLPGKSRTAILFSNYDQFALRDGSVHAAYTLYSILGEHLKSNFRFVSPTLLARGKADLGNYKLLYVPKLAYTDPELTAKLKKFVSEGGTMVVFDPRFLFWNIDGTEAAERAELTGVKAVTPREPAPELRGDFGVLPLSPNANVKLPTGLAVESYAMEGADGKVIAFYPDGAPAAVEKSYGKGKVIYFASQPFGNSSLALKPGAWLNFFDKMAKEVGEETGLAVWDFTIPEDRLQRPELKQLGK